MQTKLINIYLTLFLDFNVLILDKIKFIIKVYLKEFKFLDEFYN